MKLRSLVSVLALLAWVPLKASMLECKQLVIDFTKSEDASRKAIWSSPDKITTTDKGLLWNGQSMQRNAAWIQTKPLSVSLAWRTTSSVSVRVSIDPAPHQVTLDNGQIHTPFGGSVFVRYSPDLKHWSGWQALQQASPIEQGEDKTGRLFSAMVGIPAREREGYAAMIEEYSKLDVPWKNDEEAAVKWIVQREPEYFSRGIPFIGYVEFLFEWPLEKDQPIRSFQADCMYGISGIHYPSKDPEESNARMLLPWSYKAP